MSEKYYIKASGCGTTAKVDGIAHVVISYQYKLRGITSNCFGNLGQHDVVTTFLTPSWRTKLDSRLS